MLSGTTFLAINGSKVAVLVVTHHLGKHLASTLQYAEHYSLATTTSLILAYSKNISTSSNAPSNMSAACNSI